MMRANILAFLLLWICCGSAAATSLVAGEHHGCALTYAGAVACWGLNGNGQLGDGTVQNQAAPVPVPGLQDVTGLAAGNQHSCAVGNGKVYCWGGNRYGQLGDGGNQDKRAATLVNGIDQAIDVAAGAEHTCAVLRNGQVTCWGRNDAGQLGDGSTLARNTPMAVAGIDNARTVALGAQHSCALLNTGLVRCWGSNRLGQLGKATDSATPETVAGLTGVTRLSAGANHTCAVSNSQVYCWGDNRFGQLGRSGIALSRAPLALPGAADDVSAGGAHTCRVESSGKIGCWGNNQDGQLGLGYVSNSSAVATPIAGIDGAAVNIATGGYHSCTLTDAGGLYCWGSSRFGQLGNGGWLSQSEATVVPTLSRLLSVKSNARMSCALSVGGGVSCWTAHYSNSSYDLRFYSPTRPAPVAGLSNVSSVSINPYYTGSKSACGATESGKVFCWDIRLPVNQGSKFEITLVQNFSQVFGLDNVAELALGVFHGCALTRNSQVWCWGNNTVGQFGSGVNNIESYNVKFLAEFPGVKAIDSGFLHSCIISGDDSVVCWGDNHLSEIIPGKHGYGYLPTAIGEIGKARALFINGYSNCIINSVGAVLCWGENLASAKMMSLPNDVIKITSIKGYANSELNYCATSISAGHFCWDRLGGTIRKVVGVPAGKNIQAGPCELSSRGLHCAFGATDTTYFPILNLTQPTKIRVPGVGYSDKVIASGFYTCAFSDKKYACWGDNSYGQMADGTKSSRQFPKETPSLSDIGEIVAGQTHACALNKSSQVLCWGDNSYGQIGDNGLTPRLEPALVSNLSDVKQIALGVWHTCAINSSNRVLCWGNNHYGQLGNGATTDSAVPVAVSDLTDIISIAAGAYHTCAINVAGNVYCWGYNYYRELLDGDAPVRFSTKPVAIPELSRVKQLAAGGEHTCALTQDGAVWCWGYNPFGQLGSGDQIYRLVPQKLPKLAGVKRLVAGANHTCALNPDDTLSCWGSNSSGQLGVGNTVDRYVPTSVSGLTGVRDFALGARHTCASQADRLWCWGDSTAGQTGHNLLDYAPTINLTAVDYRNEIQRYWAWLEQQNPMRFPSAGAIDSQVAGSWLRSYTNGATVRIEGWDVYLREPATAETYMGNFAAWLAVL